MIFLRIAIGIFLLMAGVLGIGLVLMSLLVFRDEKDYSVLLLIPLGLFLIFAVTGFTQILLTTNL